MSIDLLPGPSEILIIADSTRESRVDCGGSLAQAEHGKGARFFVTDSEQLSVQVEAEVQRSALSFPAAVPCRRARRFQHVGPSPGDKWTTQSPSQTNMPPSTFRRHTEIPPRSRRSSAPAERSSLVPTRRWLRGISLPGPSHTLPTGGAGKSFPGLTVDMFQRRTSIVELDEQSCARRSGIIPGLQRSGRTGCAPGGPERSDSSRSRTAAMSAGPHPRSGGEPRSRLHLPRPLRPLLQVVKHLPGFRARRGRLRLRGSHNPPG